MSLSQDEKVSAFIVSEQSENMPTDNNISQIIEELKSEINSLKIIISNKISSDIDIINDNFIEIFNLLEILVNIIKANNTQYESLHRKNEQKIRVLYGKIFNQNLITEILENKINILNKKEKEYDLLKQKTGAIVCNGQVICNERKDNEIIILRTENSLLKSAIKNNEDLVKEKNEMINSLNNEILLYKNQVDELRKLKHGKYSSFSNINININETKKDYSQKDIKCNKHNSYINTIQVFSSKRDISSNHNLSHNKNNKNNVNNIYSSYQMNSQLINKVNISKNKFNKKEDIFQNNNSSKNKNVLIDSIGNKTYSIKYISVNKSLFSPKYSNNHKIGFNNNNNNNIKDDNKTLQINRIKKNKYKLNNELPKREYNTISIDPTCKKDVKVKKIISNKRIIIKHKKSNSIQWHDNSFKRSIKKEKSLSIENDSNSQIRSDMKKINELKNQILKNNNKSLPNSILNTASDGFRKNNKVNKCLTNFLMPYADKKSDNRGRNDNNYKIGNDYIKDNSLSFLQKNYMNRTSCENYSNNDRSFNIVYNNSQEVCKDISLNIKK